MTYNLILIVTMKNYYFQKTVFFLAFAFCYIHSFATNPPPRKTAIGYCAVDQYPDCGTKKADRVETMEVSLVGGTTVFSNVSSGSGLACRSDLSLLGYSDFTSSVITLAKGSTYTFTFKRDIIQYFSNNSIVFWIDFNGDYDLDNFDEIFVTNPVDDNSPYYTLDVVVPMTAIEGNTRLRVRVFGAESFYNACGGSGGLETEDYTINITAPLVTNQLNASAYSQICEGGILPVSYTPTGTFNSGNVFTAQLSDAAGNFTMPIVTLAGISPINLPIPLGTVGTGYKVRVVSSNPAVTSNEVPLTILPLPLPPSSGGLIPSERCPLLPPVTLTTTVSCLSGQTIIWYEGAAGGTPLSSLPSMTPIETKNYYASCKNNATGCESTARYKVTFKATAIGSKPLNAYIIVDGIQIEEGKQEKICDIVGDEIIVSKSCSTGEIQQISVDGLDYTTSVPKQIVDGKAHNYRIRCQVGTGSEACIGPESGVMSVIIYPKSLAPMVSIMPEVLCAGSPSQPLTGISTCGTKATVWFNATTNTPMASLPALTPNSNQSYYAKCQGDGGCLGEASNIVTFSLVPSNVAPLILNSLPDEICVGTEIKLTTNCPAGSTVVWNNVYKNPELLLSWKTPHIENISAKCEFTGGCATPNAVKKLVWKLIDVTIINVGESKVGQKLGVNVPLEAWSSQFVTADNGPSLEESSEFNPTVFYVENINKIAPRYWTVHVDACKQPIGGSMSYDLLCRPETGPSTSFNTHENNEPYLMFANSDNFTQLFTINHPFYGFFREGPSGENIYDQGFPKGLYKMGIRYWDQKGVGEAPAVRKAVGRVLVYKEYWFRIVSKLGVGTGPVRIGGEQLVDTKVMLSPNPAQSSTNLVINNARNQKIRWALYDQLGRELQSSEFIPETEQHSETITMSKVESGLYFIQVKGESWIQTIKVLRIK